MLRKRGFGFLSDIKRVSELGNSKPNMLIFSRFL
jgi:hypothetical protein